MEGLSTHVTKRLGERANLRDVITISAGLSSISLWFSSLSFPLCPSMALLMEVEMATGLTISKHSCPEEEKESL